MKQAPAIQLREFTEDDYDELISWVTSAEMLLQFAGPYLTYPLTREQLKLNSANESRYCFTIIDISNKISIGHAEILLTGTSALIGRVLIASEQSRGKGIGKLIIELLLHFSFNNLQQHLAELYVFDWNFAAIKCYEQCGFTANKEKQLLREINNKT